MKQGLLVFLWPRNDKMKMETFQSIRQTCRLVHRHLNETEQRYLHLFRFTSIYNQNYFQILIANIFTVD